MIEIGGVHIFPELPRFLAFALAGLALNLVPGADMTFVIVSASRGGRRRGIAAALGIGAGALVHITAAVVGLSALIASSAAAFGLLKFAGALYLLYLAVALVRARPGRDIAAGVRPASRASEAEVFRRGALVNLLNPKVAIFFLAFLPQFIDPNARSPAVQILALGLWFDLVGTFVNVAVAWGAAGAASRLRRIAWFRSAARWMGGGVMAALAVRLLIAERR